MANITTTWAVRIFEHGPASVLRYEQYPLAPVGPCDVLVRVDSASVSRFDVFYRNGLPASVGSPGRRFFPLPQQLGREASGEVVAVGSAVRRFEPGARVVAATHPENNDSLEAARGLGNLSRDIELPGHQSLGSYAQYLVRDESLWFPLSEETDLEQAAVTLWPFSTSHRVLRDRLRVSLGDVVLVLGASGGMGQATTQLARLMGARVIAVTRNKSKAEALRSLGADEVVVVDDLNQAGDHLDQLTNGLGVDHVVDYVGDNAWLAFAIQHVRLGGSVCISTVAPDPGAVPISASDFIRLELNVLGIRGARRNDSLRALDLLTQNRISTPIAARFPLSEASAAHQFLEESPNIVGRIVLKPWL